MEPIFFVKGWTKLWFKAHLWLSIVTSIFKWSLQTDCSFFKFPLKIHSNLLYTILFQNKLLYPIYIVHCKFKWSLQALFDFHFGLRATYYTLQKSSHSGLKRKLKNFEFNIFNYRRIQHFQLQKNSTFSKIQNAKRKYQHATKLCHCYH